MVSHVPAFTIDMYFGTNISEIAIEREKIVIFIRDVLSMGLFVTGTT